MEPKIEAIVQDNNLVGEGPIWDNGRSRLTLLIRIEKPALVCT